MHFESPKHGLEKQPPTSEKNNMLLVHIKTELDKMVCAYMCVCVNDHWTGSYRPYLQLNKRLEVQQFSL